MTKKTFYITTAIDYVNAEPHIGHAYQKIIGDVLARWHRLLGEEVFFLTGTDEHGKKVQQTAEKAGKSPREFVDEISKKFKEAWKALNISYDRFIRTTDQDHIKLVQEIIRKADKAGDIYKGKYEGYYCTGCEAYYTEKDVTNLECPFHKRPLEILKEESYFFRLSKYQNFLLKLYQEHPELVLPETRRNEVISRVKEGLKDLSISRTSFNWGIPFPLDKKHVVYVWYDALLNYYTATRKKGKEKFWPADVHLLGKDNTWFHTVYWPAMLKSVSLPLPKTIFNHGFISFNGQKISKSLGNAISPITLVEKYSADSVRYFVCRHFPFASGDDGNFEESALVARHNNELADKLGNLVSRVSTLAEKYKIKKTENTIAKRNLKLKVITKHFENYEFDRALNEIFAFIDICNEYVQKTQPWKSGDKEIIYELADSIKTIAILLSPFIPETAEKISKVFNFDISLKSLNSPLKISKIKKAQILFTKIGSSPKEEASPKKAKIEGIATMENLIQYGDWEKLDLRVAKVKKVEDIDGADKLYKLTLDVGELGERVVCAGLKEHYKKEELKNKKLIYFSNLTPRKMRGIESCGMILAAVNKDHSKVVLLAPEKEIDTGSRVS